MKFSLASFRCRLGPTVFYHGYTGFSKHEQMKFNLAPFRCWSGPTPFYHGYVLSLLKASSITGKMLQHCGVTLNEQYIVLI